MVASTKTLDALAAVVLKHMTPGKARDMMKDMLEIPGNKSFRETLVGLQERLRLCDRRPRAKPRRSELPRDQHDGENDA
jgi:hypothetical protein